MLVVELDDMIADLLRAFGAVNQHVPEVIRKLAIGELSPHKQHQFASLLTQLGELLHQHADAHTPSADEARRAGLNVRLSPEQPEAGYDGDVS